MRKVIPLLILAITFAGCSVESYDSAEDILTIDARGSQKQEETAAVFNIPDMICAGVETTLSISVAVGTNIQVQQYDTTIDEWIQVFQIAKSDNDPQEFEMIWDEPGTYRMRYKAGSGGFTEQSLTVIACGTCEETFSYENKTGDDDKMFTYLFNYTSAENISNAELSFTFAQGSEITGLSGWVNNGNGNSRVFQKTQNLEACKTYSWTVGMVGECRGSVPNSNIFTDFKVNEVSKKTEEYNTIIWACKPK